MCNLFNEGPPHEDNLALQVVGVHNSLPSWQQISKKIEVENDVGEI